MRKRKKPVAKLLLIWYSVADSIAKICCFRFPSGLETTFNRFASIITVIFCRAVDGGYFVDVGKGRKLSEL